ncbi:MAG TPA: alpha/beta hydrolase [Clostridiales bacterium]|nr:alpha/beta hydrolase [Clostridiales bacterium]
MITANRPEYDSIYPRLIGSGTPLAELREKDVATLSGWDESHPLLANRPDPRRVDYYDVAYGTDPMQKLDIHLRGDTPKPGPIVFYIHGGGWSSGDKNFSRFFAPTLLDAGYTLISINYRLQPQFPFPAQIEDCALALKWVEDNGAQYGCDANRIAVTGDSAGGHLTALLVIGKKWHQQFDLDISRVKCWIPVSGDHDLMLAENRYSGMMIDMAEVFGFDQNGQIGSPVNHVSGGEPPCLIMHGGDDWLVPKSNSEALAAKLRDKGSAVELRIVEGYMHCNMSTRFGLAGHEPTSIMMDYLARMFPAN